MSEQKPFIGINVGTGQIIMPPSAYELRPTEIYLKEDGAKDNTPSVGILFTDPYNITHPVLGQLSLKMWNEGLADIGYKIVKI